METFQTSQDIKIHQYLAQSKDLFNNPQQHCIKTFSSSTVLEHEYWPASITKITKIILFQE